MMELQRTDNEKAPPAQSILGVMKHFIDAVNDMDETVLIPSRLMDIKMDVQLENGELNSNNVDSSLSVIPTSLKNGSSLPPTEQVSLHTYYSVLKAVKRELARGPLSEDELMEEEEDSTSQGGEASAKLQAVTARAFREHLRGLFSILSQLTNVSQYLTSRYQQETGDQQSCLKPKTFSV